MLNGPGLEACQEALAPYLTPEIAWAPPELRLPRAATLARLARYRLESGQTANPAQIVPTYLRPAL